MAKRVLKDKVNLTLPLERVTLNMLESFASENGLSVNSYIRVVVMTHVRERLAESSPTPQPEVKL